MDWTEEREAVLHEVSDGEFDRVAVRQPDNDGLELADREYVGDGEVLVDDESLREEQEDAVELEEREAVLHKVSEGEFDWVAVWQPDNDGLKLADREYVGDGEVLVDDESLIDEHEDAVILVEREAVLHKVSDGEFDRVAVWQPVTDGLELADLE